MKIPYGLFIALISAILSGCTLLAPVPSDTQTRYVLKTVPSVPVQKSRKQITLLVETPDANAFYDTRLMAYSTHPWQIAYYAKSTWLGKPANMLQPLIIQSLQNTKYFYAVISPIVGASAQYSLDTHIEEFLQDYTHGRPCLKLTLKARIIRLSSNRVIATRQFVIVQPMLQASPYGGVMAANQATANMLQQLTRFCLNTL